jgi:hypothetical protein
MIANVIPIVNMQLTIARTGINNIDLQQLKPRHKFVKPILVHFLHVLQYESKYHAYYSLKSIHDSND